MVLKKWIQKGIDWLSNLILAAAGLVVLWLFLLVFHFPHPHTWEKIEMHLFKYYVKRCIALPGDTIISYTRQYPKRIAAMLLASVLLLAGGAYGMYHLKKDSADGRLLMWKVSTQIIREQRGLGVGVGHFPEAFAEAQASYLKHASSQEKWVAGCPEYAFNEYLQIAVELGIFPLMLFLGVGGGAFFLAVRTKQSGISGALIAFAIFAFSSYPLQLPDF